MQMVCAYSMCPWVLYAWLNGVWFFLSLGDAGSHSWMGLRALMLDVSSCLGSVMHNVQVSQNSCFFLYIYHSCWGVQLASAQVGSLTTVCVAGSSCCGYVGWICPCYSSLQAFKWRIQRRWRCENGARFPCGIFLVGAVELGPTTKQLRPCDKFPLLCV